MLEVEDSTVVSPGAVRVTFASGTRGFELVTPSDASFTNGTPRDRGDGKDGYQWLSFSRSPRFSGARQQCQHGAQRCFRLTRNLSLAENQQSTFMSRKEG
jgi:hypothetical protein